MKPDTRTPKKIDAAHETLALIARLARSLETTRKEYLVDSGWEYTSNTPGCYWMYKRTMPDGSIALVDEETAFRMQSHWDTAAHAYLHPEQYSD